MATNEFLPIANGALATVTTQASWAGSSKQVNGFPTGLVARADMNKALRQASVIAAAFAQAMSDLLDEDVLDDGDLTSRIDQIKLLLARTGNRDLPRRTSGFVSGECTALSAGATIDLADLATDKIFSIYNDSAASIVITQGSGVTLRKAGTTGTGNITIAPRGMMTAWCNSDTEAICTGPGVS